MGLKKRDCRRQRGADPTRIRSRPAPFRLARRSRPERAGANDLALDLDTVLAGELASPPRATPRPVPLPRRALRRAARRAAPGSRAAPSAWRTCSSASLIAVASTSSPIGPSFIGTRMWLVQPLVVRLDEVGDGLLDAGGASPTRGATDEHEDHAADRGARSAPQCVPSMGGERRRSRSRGERRSEQGDERDGDAADADIERRAVRAREIRLAEAEPDHGELRSGERDQDAEAVQAREEPHGRADRRPTRSA